MKNLYLFLLVLTFSCCSTVKDQKNSSTKPDTQLLKDVQTLSSAAYEGRKTGTKGAEMARQYLINRFNKLGLKSYPQHVIFAQDFKFKNRADQEVNGRNLIAYIPGQVEQAIVISAHYDHVGVIKDKIYHGADDNASGVGALLKIASYFSKNKPHFTLIFAAFDAEEMGLQGAKTFVSNPPISIEKIKLNINMDMISHNDKSELYVAGTYKYPELKKFIPNTYGQIKILFGHDDPKQGRDDWTNQSDQGAFNAKDIPFLYFGVEDHKDYHQPTDTFENINPAFYNDAVNAILNTIKNINQDGHILKLFKEKLQMKTQ